MRLMASPDHGGHEVLVEAGEAVLGASVVTSLQQPVVTSLRDREFEYGTDNKKNHIKKNQKCICLPYSQP